ncbi:MAG: VIT1/CCC1 transporter family protein [Chloroflexota bacterium]|nr:VIT1/CCC1 transporter family protein [Chloroflexota bacterium]MDE2884725.1 VIT1/CCC1 transporter family protein [Chloroflexota bacterium]
MTTLIQTALTGFRRAIGLNIGHLAHGEHHHRTGGASIREVVFGANDGLVSNTALVAAVAGGTSDTGIIILGGVAGAVAGTISMALGAYVSTKSQRELHESEEAREFWEIEHMREDEIEETRRIFRLKGITGPLLDEVVDVVSRDHDQWVQLMMTEELGLPSKPPKPYLAASVMGVSFAFAAIVPVLPFFVAEGAAALAAAFVMSGVALFTVGAWRAALTQGNTLHKGAEMVVLAGIAVAAAYGIGTAVGVAV